MALGNEIEEQRVKQLFIIAGPNGAGKTTASFTLLPEILKIKEFVNADEIAKGISPFNPEGAAFAAGRVMLSRINELLEQGESFAFETTLATKSYHKSIDKAQSLGYKVILLFFYLNSPQLAEARVKLRVKQGGHNIPKEIIYRRFKRGLANLCALYIIKADIWYIFDNSSKMPLLIAEGAKDYSEKLIYDEAKWKKCSDEK